MQHETSDSIPQGTRLALIEAGLHLFGKQSFAATSTRQLAARAQTNIGSITYHFGGKESLRQACAEEFVRRLEVVLNSVPERSDLSPAVAHRQLQDILRGLVAFLIGGRQAETMVPFMLHELAEGGPTVELFYQRLGEPTHRRLCALWANVTGDDPNSDAVRLSVFSLIGQVLYFRIAGVIVARRMGWAAVGPQEVDQIMLTLLGNLDALLGKSEKD